jgi:hypothetical protein
MHACAGRPAPSAHVHCAFPHQRWGGGAAPSTASRCEVRAGEFDALARALRVASSEQLIGKRWHGACSSTELMADVFTLPK